MFLKKGYFNLQTFQNGVSILGKIVLERGVNLEFWAAHTHPKNTQVPPPPWGPDHTSVRRQRDLGIFKKRRGFSNLICNLSQVLRNDYGAGGQGLEAVAMYVMHKDMLLSRSSCAGEVRTSRASWVSNSTHPRKFGNHVTEH